MMLKRRTKKEGVGEGAGGGGEAGQGEGSGDEQEPSPTGDTEQTCTKIAQLPTGKVRAQTPALDANSLPFPGPGSLPH